MQRALYPQPWAFRPSTSGPPPDFEIVEVPHDALLAAPRVDDPAHQGSGYFPGGAWEYRTTLAAPPDWRQRHLVLEFEAIHRSAAVFVNGDVVARRPSGTASIIVELDSYLHDGENEIVVTARTDRDARWYTGGGITRPVHIAIGPKVHVPLDGIVVTAPEHDDEASLVEVVTTVHNLDSAPAVRWLETSVVAPDGTVAGVDRTRVSVPAGRSVEASQRILVMAPQRWSVDSPNLYVVESALASRSSGFGDEADRSSVTFGIRSLQLDARRGLRINGAPVDLRGACVHADNGVIGGATFDAAEERRVAILKASGFNAIRSAHQPLSRAMLDACDRLGMLVMDELTDMWTRPKSSEDGAEHFSGWWRRDLESMVVKDRNHPSVIIYSIGNEIPEAGTRSGSELTRALTAATKRLDPTRYVTAAVNGALFVMPGEVPIDIDLLGGASLDDVQELRARKLPLADWMSALATTDAVSALTEEAYGGPDIAGMNYQDARYEFDRDRHPNRVIVGSETFPTEIDRIWSLVRRNSHVIGDFTWTGWDYLGEPGLGRMHYEDDPVGGGGLGDYPYLISGAGDIDITGERRPASYYREIVFGLRSQPYLAVRRPETRGRVMRPAPWSWTDSIPSWTWPDPGTDPLEVEVYSDAPEVELLLEGRSLGRKPTGSDHRYRAVFEVEFSAGLLEAVAIRDGAAAERTALQTAGAERHLALTAERTAVASDGRDLAFVSVELVDVDGVRASDADAEIGLQVDGPGVLQGFGSSEFATEQSFVDATHRLHDGRALAVVRPTSPGRIVVTATAPGYPSATVTLDVA